MNRDILKRLERLESQSSGRGDAWPMMLWIMHPLTLEQTGTLKPDERIVNDWYRDTGGIVWLRERIVNEPCDSGQRCAPGGYLAEALHQIHRECPYRHQGACRQCAGTPVAERDERLLNES